MEGINRGRNTKPICLLVLFSFCLNVFFGCYIYLSAGRRSPGWSFPAAEEAEAVAALSCSDHGRAYVDGVIVDDVPACECNSCYAGKDCSLLVPNCVTDAESGDPMFLEPYWRQNAARSAILIASWHRMSYSTNSVNFKSFELERHLRLLHNSVSNAVTLDRFIVFGTGATQLINAAVYALSPDQTGNHSISPAVVVASAPYYRLYKLQNEMFDSRENIWGGLTSSLLNLNASSSGKKFIELVTSPNNPDGMLKFSMINGSAVICDRTYYWPHFSSIPAPADEDIMLFSASKLSGHAGSRFGWALVKDEKVYQKMAQYVWFSSVGASRDTQLRILKLIKSILADVRGKEDIFEFGYRTLNERWTKLSKVVSSPFLPSKTLTTIL